MRIERAVLREVPLTLATPFRSSAGVVTERRVLLLELRGEGLTGWSECVAPSAPTYTYETVDTAWHVLTEQILPGVVGSDASDPERALAAAGSVRGHPMAKATAEMAAWDVAARGAGRSLAELLGGTRAQVDVGVSVGMVGTVDELSDVIAGHLEDGYGRVKVKIGPGWDVEPLTALRERFPDVALWADANSAYADGEAGRLRELDSLSLGMIEEPLAPGDFLGHGRLQEGLRTPICLDESIGSEVDVRLALELGSCRVVNLKPGRVGGLTESLRIHELLSGRGVPLWCGGMLETGIGRAFNVALASLRGFTLPGDISASGRYWERDIVSPAFAVKEGRMAVPTGPGIGVDVDVERIEALTAREAVF